MLSDDLMTTIQRLPLDEKVALLEVLMRTVKDEIHHVSSTPTDLDAQRLTDILGGGGQPPPFEELRGILTVGSPVTAAYDWKDDYTDYLTKKYA